MDLDMNGGGGGNKRTFQRLVGASNHQKVCFHWRAGRCNRYPCPFLHRELPAPAAPFSDDGSGFAGSSYRRGGPGSVNNNSWGRFGGNKTVVKTEKLCKFWADGSCPYGDKCKYLHCWSQGDSFSLLTQLDGHHKVVTGIALPSGSDKLYTSSKDETLKDLGLCFWTGVLNIGGEAGCMISEGPWLLVGMPNLVKAWNIQTNVDLSLTGPVGQVYSLVVATDLLFAGTQDGSILVWRYNIATNCFDPAASLTGHTLAVVSLYVGANRLYSGSMDYSIKVWSLDNLQCVQTLAEHTSVVMSLIFWDQFLDVASRRIRGQIRGRERGRKTAKLKIYGYGYGMDTSIYMHMYKYI